MNYIVLMLMKFWEKSNMMKFKNSHSTFYFMPYVAQTLWVHYLQSSLLDASVAAQHDYQNTRRYIYKLSLYANPLE